MNLAEQLRDLQAGGGLDLPHPGRGNTAERHRRLAAIGRQDLALARLAEGHADALAILADAGRTPEPGALYAVWASETSHCSLRLERGTDGLRLNGSKMFCTGAGLVDQALVTVSAPERLLIRVDLRVNERSIRFEPNHWHTPAFRDTQTSTTNFIDTPIACEDVLGDEGWYLERPGFWHGACGPASCWAGGAAGLLDYALAQARNDAHTLAHLGAMRAANWGMLACLDSAGNEIDAGPADQEAAFTRALSVRHLIEQACSDVLHRFLRAYGPRPIAFDAAVSKRYYELDLYLRQSHAERDLEALGQKLISRGQDCPSPS